METAQVLCRYATWARQNRPEARCLSEIAVKFDLELQRRRFRSTLS